MRRFATLADSAGPPRPFRKQSGMTTRSLHVAKRQGAAAAAPPREAPPLILMTADITDPGTRETDLECTLRMNYAKAGGVPLILPCERH
jgi:hypothetical protein